MFSHSCFQPCAETHLLQTVALPKVVAYMLLELQRHALSLFSLVPDLQEFATLVRSFQGVSKELRLMFTSRRALGASLPECKLIELDQLAPEAALQALCHYSTDAPIKEEHQQQLVESVCSRNPFALSIVGALLRDHPSRAEVSCVQSTGWPRAHGLHTL